MSRTFRHIPFHLRTIQPYEKHWHSLYLLGVVKNGEYKYDPRHNLVNGYDGSSQSYYFMVFDRHLGGKDNYTGDSRKFIKREFSRLRRLQSKRIIEQEVWE